MRAAGALCVALVLPRVGRAQDTFALPPEPPSSAGVEGRVVIPGKEREIGVPGVMVTVHRVGPDSAGPQDSVRTDAQGRYTLHYRRFGSDQAVYFAAALYGGIAYFTERLHAGLTRGDAAEITVFDTTSHAVPISIQGHHIVVAAPGPTGTREVVEVYELSNDSTVTAVARDGPVWSAPFPRGASNFVGRAGDVGVSNLAVSGNRVTLTAAFGPGIRQLTYSYTLDDRGFPLRFALEKQTGLLEVLLEEPGAQARAASLRAQDPATLEGRTYKRFIARGAPAGEEVRIDVPAAAASARTRVLIAVATAIVVAMLGALVLAFTRRTPRAVATESSAARAERLAAAIAALDARHESGDASLDATRYAEERAVLMTQLSAALAQRAEPS